MVSLIIKDVLLQKRHILLSFIYILIIIVSFQKVGAGMFTAGVVAFTYILILTSCAYEDKNKADVMVNSLPIKRSNIVLAKYISTFIFLLMGISAYLVFTFIFKLVNLPVVIHPATLEGAVGALLSVSLLTGLYFPVFFKFGYIKSKIVVLIIFFGFFFGMPQIVNYLYSNQEAGWVKRLIEFISSGNEMIIILGTASASVIILLISYSLSVHFYKNREF